jgi:signal transduction histidine kinase
MKIFSLVLFLSFAFKPVFSLPGSPANRPDGTEDGIYAKVDRLNSAAGEIFLNYPDSAHKLAGAALLLAEKIGYPFGKGRSFLELGRIYWSQSYYAISLFYLKSAISNLPKDKTLYLAEAYRALGRTYADLKDCKTALAYLDTAFRLYGNNAIGIAEVYSERAYVYNLCGVFDKAIDNARLSGVLHRETGDAGNIAVLYGRLASIYLHKKDYKTALAYNDTAFRMSLKVHNRRLLACSYVDYAALYNAAGRYTDAIAFANKGIALSDTLGVMDAETRGYNALQNAYELQHNYLKALDCQRKYSAVRDSLSNLAKQKTITLVQNYYDLSARMNSIALMTANDRVNQAKIKSQHNMIRLLLFSLAIVMCVLTFTYYFYKQKKLLSSKLQQQHRALSDQKQVIELQKANLQRANDLKDKLFAVIGHDLRSPVANLTNIISMFDDGYLSAEEVHDLMRNINPVMKGVELTLSNLVEWAGSQIKGVNVSATNVDIFLMGMEMEQTFLPALHSKKLEFLNKAYPGRGAIADENHLKVILRNLISNAIKFTPANGSITLGTTIENNELIISIKDSGKGMTEEELSKLFYINTHFSNSGTAGEKGTGIGLLLVKELVELNGGKLGVKSKAGKGSTFYFNLPLVNAYV